MIYIKILLDCLNKKTTANSVSNVLSEILNTRYYIYPSFEMKVGLFICKVELLKRVDTELL